MNNTENLLEIQDLSVEFRTDDGVVKAVNHMNLQLQRGKTLGLVGETGAGKTTTALSILRLIPDPPGVITGGSIRLGDTDILASGKREMEKLRAEFSDEEPEEQAPSLKPVQLPPLRQLLEKKYGSLLHDPKGQARAIRGLMRRGYPYGEIRREIEALQQERETEE